MPNIINNIITYIVNPAIVFLFSLAFVYFLWGVFNFVHHADEAEKRKEGANSMIYGIIGLAIMMSAFGIVHFLINIINVPADQRPTSVQGL